MQDSTLSETANLFLVDESHLCERGGVWLNKDICICFVLPKDCVLDFYWVGETAMCNHNQNGVKLTQYTVIFSILVVNIGLGYRFFI